MSKLLIIAFEGDEALQLSGFAATLGMPFDVLCLSGSHPLEIGAAKVLTAGLNEVPPADALAQGLHAFTAGYSHIAALSNMRSKDVMARLAGLMEAAMVSDVVAVDSPTQFRRPIVAGSVLATVQVLAEPVLLTVRPAGFPAQAPSGSSPTEAVSFAGSGNTVRASVSSRGGSRPDLTQARVVVSGGRPLGDAETFERVIGGFADALGGAAGATRAAVDSGIAPNELQVGQTGKIVAPELYIAAGISGSTQHMAGIKDSKLIVAINKDADAPIFEFADLGIVGDLFEVIPAMRSQLGI